jgi:hypothetical protein
LEFPIPLAIAFEAAAFNTVLLLLPTFVSRIAADLQGRGIPDFHTRNQDISRAVREGGWREYDSTKAMSVF